MIRAPAGMCVVGVVAAVVAAAARAGGEPPTMLPGAKAVVTGTHVSCTVTGTSVTCTKAGGWTATLDEVGAVRFSRTAPPAAKAAKVVRLGLNGGFVLAGAPVYCHVYADGGPTLTCSDESGARGGMPSSHGFDENEHVLVLFRYDAAHVRHDVKTYPQS